MRESATTLEPEMTEDELNFLRDHLKDNLVAAGVLEIGTAAGGTLCEMMKVFSDQDRPLFSVVDPMSYFPDQLGIVKTNLIKYGFNKDEPRFLIGRSDDLFKEAKDRGDKFDFILVDGSHKVLYVTQDVQWAGLLQVNGAIFFHDYYFETPGVISAVDRFLKVNNNYEIIKQVDTLIGIRKTKESTRLEVNALDKIRVQFLRQIHQWKISYDKRFKN